MGTVIGDLYDHEGYAARKLPDGTLTGTWTADTSEFVGYVAACSCSVHGVYQGSEWYGSTVHPATDEGEEAAVDEWERVHARPLLGETPPADLDDEVTALLDRLRTLATDRPAASLSALRRIERGADELLSVAVAGAREAGRSWADIGSPLRMTRQAAQQRFGSSKR